MISGPCRGSAYGIMVLTIDGDRFIEITCDIGVTEAFPRSGFAATDLDDIAREIGAC